MNKPLAKPLRLFFSAVLGLGLLPANSLQADEVEELLGNALACELIKRELVPMEIEPLYQVADGQCAAVTPDAEQGAWFSDDQCTTPVNYVRTAMQDYCLAASDRANLGSGIGIKDDSWTLTPGNRIDLGARPLEGKTQPYMQRLIYRQVQTTRGRCDLEMRIYKSHPTATEQRSMLALHGGSWTSRSFGYLGLELSVPHFIEQGFVVYAPFYRLLDNTDSSSACNQAQFHEIVEDANAALDWVTDNSAQYGSRGKPVVFGQSAGGHLALSLSVNHPNQISGGVLMYPPTDFGDFLQRVQSGAYTNPQGLSILERVVGASLEQASLALPVVGENSFPQRVASEGGTWPPLFIVQGSADDLVEARQSVRLCDALAGRTLPDVDVEVGNAVELRDVVACGTATEPASTLHLIKLGKHALDICINPSVPDLCLSGGAASQALVSQSINDATLFAVAAHETSRAAENPVVQTPTGDTPAGDTPMTDVASTVSTGGGGALGLFSLFLLLWLPKSGESHRSANALEGAE